MDAILFKMFNRSIIIFAMVITLFFFLIKRKKFHDKLTNKEYTVLKIMAAIFVCIFLYKMFLPIILDIPCYRNGIYYYDDSYCFEYSNKENNVYFIADSFEEFWKILR